jgi:hypothetical protein
LVRCDTPELIKISAKSTRAIMRTMSMRLLK